MSAKSSLRTVPLSMVRENPIALRAVNKDDEKYPGLVDSIRNVGVLSPITVRDMKDPDSGQQYFSLVDGLHRYNAALDAGNVTEIPVHILSIDDAKALEIQLMANVHSIQTRPVEYSKQLSRILASDPLLTAAVLSSKLGVNPTWVAQRLGLTKLTDSIGKLVDDGEITVSNALVLAKLPAEEQQNFVTQAMTMSPTEFTPIANNRVKEIRDAKRQGREAKPAEFVPVARLRKLSEFNSELDGTTKEILEVFRATGARTPAEYVHETLKWCVHLDTTSVDAARAKDDARRAEEQRKKDERKAEQLAKKTSAATDAAARVAEANAS